MGEPQRVVEAQVREGTPCIIGGAELVTRDGAPCEGICVNHQTPRKRKLSVSGYANIILLGRVRGLAR